MVGSSKVPVRRLSNISSPQAGGRGAFEGKRIVFVELGNPGWRNQLNLATFRRSWISPLKVLKAGRVFDVAKLGVSVGGLSRLGRSEQYQRCSQGRTQEER